MPSVDLHGAEAAPAPVPGRGPDSPAAELVRYAVLAPSTHNSQPWKFHAGEDVVSVYADHTRWLRVADPDQRELHVSVGCALENVVIAARYGGYAPEVRYFPQGEDAHLVAEVHLRWTDDPLDPVVEKLFHAIPLRHTNRRRYDARPLTAAQTDALTAVADEADVRVHLTDDADLRLRADALVVRADALQFADPRWREEFGFWLGAGSLGTGWLLSRMSTLAVTYLNPGEPTARNDVGLLRNAAALGVVSVAAPDRRAQVRAGRIFQRLFLTATEMGINLQPMNQLLQVPEVRVELEALLPSGWGVPQMAFRVGHAEPERQPPRRMIEEVLA